MSRVLGKPDGIEAVVMCLFQFLRVPVERVGVYLLRFERGLQSP